MRNIINDTRPTTIYWLVDMLTKVPFYCGKTVLPPHKRLACHKYDARKGTTRVNVKVRECGEHIQIYQMESVPVGGDWSAREKRWIVLLRHINPNCCNTNAGGAGMPGWVPTAETRAKLSAMFKGRSTHSAETRAHLSAIGMGRKRSPESVEKGRKTNAGFKHTPDVLARLSAVQKARYAGERGDELRSAIGLRRKGVIASDETRAKQSAAHTGRKRTPEEKEKLRIANTGRKMPAEAVAKSAAARTGAKRTPEQRARMSAAHAGKKWSQAQHAAHKGKKWGKTQSYAAPLPPCPIPAPLALA